MLVDVEKSLATYLVMVVVMMNDDDDDDAKEAKSYQNFEQRIFQCWPSEDEVSPIQYCPV